MSESVSQSVVQPDATRQRESAMIARIVAGERELFHDLIRPYERMLFNACHAMLRNPEDAEDAVQDAVLKAFRGLKSFRAEAKFSTWMVTIATNEARTRLRRQKIAPMESLEAQTEELEGDVTPAILKDWRPVPSDVLESKEMRHLIEQAVGELPPIYREVFMLRDVEELNVQETAEALGIEPGAVKTRLHRARMMLQKQLAPALAAGEESKGSAGGFFRRWPWKT
jgi:RNA polymerase sigma-70 factor (ECF subfamily)